MSKHIDKLKARGSGCPACGHYCTCGLTGSFIQLPGGAWLRPDDVSAVIPTDTGVEVILESGGSLAVPCDDEGMAETLADEIADQIGGAV